MDSPNCDSISERIEYWEKKLSLYYDCVHFIFEVVAHDSDERRMLRVIQNLITDSISNAHEKIDFWRSKLEEEKKTL